MQSTTLPPLRFRSKRRRDYSRSSGGCAAYPKLRRLNVIEGKRKLSLSASASTPITSAKTQQFTMIFRVASYHCAVQICRQQLAIQLATKFVHAFAAPHVLRVQYYIYSEFSRMYCNLLIIITIINILRLRNEPEMRPIAGMSANVSKKHRRYIAMTAQ